MRVSMPRRAVPKSSETPVAGIWQGVVVEHVTNMGKLESRKRDSGCVTDLGSRPGSARVY